MRKYPERKCWRECQHFLVMALVKAMLAHACYKDGLCKGGEFQKKYSVFPKDIISPMIRF